MLKLRFQKKNAETTEQSKREWQRDSRQDQHAITDKGCNNLDKVKKEKKMQRQQSKENKNGRETV